MTIDLSSVAAGLFALHSIGGPPAPTPAPAASLIVASSALTGSIVRAQFTSAIKDRQPTDSLTSAGTDKSQISFFTELKGLSGSKVTHRWEHDGTVVREQTFDVGGDRWRVWSNKSMDAHATGEWKVTVVDGAGSTLGSYTLTYGK